MPYLSIGVVGSGVVACELATLAAHTGSHVFLICKEKHRAFVNKTIERVQSRLRRRDKEPTSVTSGLFVGSDMRSVVSAHMVVEAITESRQAKLIVYKELNRLLTRNTILASTTSSLSIKTLARDINRTDSFIGFHPFMPIDIMPLVEIGVLPSTTNSARILVEQFASSLNKVSVCIMNPLPGYVVNRLLFVLINAAARMISTDKLCPENVDASMRNGCGHSMGPLQTADMIGLDTVLSIMINLHEQSNDSAYLPAEQLVNLVAQGHLGRKTGHGFYPPRIK